MGLARKRSMTGVLSVYDMSRSSTPSLAHSICVHMYVNVCKCVCMHESEPYAYMHSVYVYVH